MNSFKNFSLFLNAIMSLLGIGILSLFVLLDSVALRMILLFLGITITFSAIFKWLNLLFISLPEGHCKRLASSVGVFSGGLYYVLYGQSLIWIALAWLFLGTGFLATGTTLLRTLIETALLRKLLRAYKGADLPNLPVPLAYVHAEPGLGVYLAQRLVAKVMNSLWQHQYLSPKSGLSVYVGTKRKGYMWKHRQRGMIVFLVSDSLRRYPADFRRWLISHSVTFIGLYTIHRLTQMTYVAEDFRVRSPHLTNSEDFKVRSPHLTN